MQLQEQFQHNIFFYKTGLETQIYFSAFFTRYKKNYKKELINFEFKVMILKYIIFCYVLYLQGAGGCEQACRLEEGVAVCSCHPGHTLQPDNKTCRDIDECADDNGGCSQICINRLVFSASFERGRSYIYLYINVRWFIIRIIYCSWFHLRHLQFHRICSVLYIYIYIIYTCSSFWALGTKVTKVDPGKLQL